MLIVFLLSIPTWGLMRHVVGAMGSGAGCLAYRLDFNSASSDETIIHRRPVAVQLLYLLQLYYIYLFFFNDEHIISLWDTFSYDIIMMLHKIFQK